MGGVHKLTHRRPPPPKGDASSRGGPDPPPQGGRFAGGGSRPLPPKGGASSWGVRGLPNTKQCLKACFEVTSARFQGNIGLHVGVFAPPLRVTLCRGGVQHPPP